MSRSNPSDSTPNPAVRWFTWQGEQGFIRYYDRETKKTVDVGTKFTFTLLDQLGSVGGWHEPSQSPIYSNEVRDTRQDVLLVKAFKGGTIAEGLYQGIKDKAAVAGGHFVAVCYIAFLRGEQQAIGVLKFRGAALAAWMEFTKTHRADLYKKAVSIDGFVEGKKGRVIFRVPKFALTDLAEADQRVAVNLDEELQTFLGTYLKRTKRDQADVSQGREAADDDTPDGGPPFVPDPTEISF
jgi:hypothetical protein